MIKPDGKTINAVKLLLARIKEPDEKVTTLGNVQVGQRVRLVSIGSVLVAAKNRDEEEVITRGVNGQEHFDYPCLVKNK